MKPKHNFDPLAGGWGAWELAARVAVVDAHDAVAAGIATPKTGQGAGNNHKTVEYTFGVNWWMTPNVAMRIDWEHLSFDTSRVLGRFTGLRKGEDEIYIRWQIDF